MNSILSPAELTAILAGTNNGYLFAPTAQEVMSAMLYPRSFSCVPTLRGIGSHIIRRKTRTGTRIYRIKDVSKRPSVRRMTALLSKSRKSPETYGVFCSFEGYVSGATWHLSEDRKESVSFDSLEKKNGVTEMLVTICRPI